MAEIISLQIDAKVGDAINATKSLKQQLKEASDEAQHLAAKYGDTSEQAINAAKKTAVLKEQLSDFKGTVDALNPEAKFRAIGQVAQGIAGGFAAAQGAMALFGTQSAEVEKTLLKVQGALALSEGLNTIMGLGDAFKNLKVVISGAANSFKAYIGWVEGATISENLATVATKALGAAMNALPLVLIGTLVVGLGKIWSDYNDEQEKIAEAEKKRNEEAIKNLEERKKKTSDLTTETEARRIQLIKDAREKEIALENEEFRKIVKNLDDQNVTVEAFRAAAQVEYEIHLKKLADIDDKYNKEAEEKRKNEAKKTKDALDAKKKANETDAVDSITYKNEVNRELVDLDIKAKEESLQAEVDRIAKAKQLREQERQDAIKNRLEISAATVQITQNTLTALSDINSLREQAEIQAAHGNKTKIAAIEKEYFERNKKIQIAQATIATFQSAIQAYQSVVGIPVAGPALAIAAATAATAVGLANIAKIKQTQFNGGTSANISLGTTPSNNSASNGVSFANSPAQQGTILNSQGINQSGIDTNFVKAIVVETDITNTQNKVNKIKNNAVI